MSFLKFVLVVACSFMGALFINLGAEACTFIALAVGLLVPKVSLPKSQW